MTYGTRDLAALALALAALLSGTSAGAQDDPTQNQNDAVGGFQSAGDLLRKCRENSSFGRSYCFAYLAATADAARSYRVWLGSGDPCLPATLSLGRLADVFDAYLVANPSLTDAQAASVMVAALQEAFPCTILPYEPVMPETDSAPVVGSDQNSSLTAK